MRRRRLPPSTTRESRGYAPITWPGSRQERFSSDAAVARSLRPSLPRLRQRRYPTLGTKAEGWTQARAEEELQNVLADVRRGLWQPSSADSRGTPTRTDLPRVRLRWFEAMRHEGLARNTLLDYEWQLTHTCCPLRSTRAVGDHDRRGRPLSPAEGPRGRITRPRSTRRSPGSHRSSTSRSSAS